jgi:cytochrome c oxidase cbb3-type subunit 3
MSDQDKEVDAHSGVETTGHTWDGIKELNNPLPRWWLIVWYICIAWGVLYMIFMPAIPALPGFGGTNTPGVLGQSDRAIVADKIATMQTERGVSSQRLLTASLTEIRNDLNLQQFAMAMGESAFGDNCATCHGAGGRGAKGYPMLADDVWLWSGTLDGIEQTLRHGIRHEGDDQTRFSAMPAFGRDNLLSSAQIDDLVQHVLSFSGRQTDREAASQGATLFASQCASCHGNNAKGSRDVGAPDLTDAEWVFGGEPSDITTSISNARNAHMPAWQGRLDDPTIKALALYVHSLGGGE